MKKAGIYTFLFMLFSMPCLAGETIYTWRDNNGVKRFSDYPPEHVKYYDTIAVPPEDSESPGYEEGSRHEYDQMIEKIRREKRQDEMGRIQAEKDRADNEKKKKEENFKNRVEAEIKDLEGKIVEINKKPVSRSYSLSRKNAQIAEIERQLEKLKNTPEEYFKSR
jgi:hypothetical protein